MRACVQRVTEARVTVDEVVTGAIQHGLLVLLGVCHSDGLPEVQYLSEKIVHLRLFNDEHGKMNRSLLDVRGELLVVSQFTLLADCRKGRRPSFLEAAPPELAERLYRAFLEEVQRRGVPVAEGRFQTHMRVHLVNDGPVTLILEAKH